MRTNDDIDLMTGKIIQYRKSNKRLIIILLIILILLLCFVSLLIHQISKKHKCVDEQFKHNSTLLEIPANINNNNEFTVAPKTRTTTDNTDFDDGASTIQGPANDASVRAPKICQMATWSDTAVTVAGRLDLGSALNQLHVPLDIFVDSHNAIYIADSHNHRVVKWDEGASEARVVAGGNGVGNQTNQTSSLSALFLDSQESIYVADGHNHRIQKWPKNSKSGETIIGHLGPGKRLDQINKCWGLYVDREFNVYVSEHLNHRVTKWAPGAKSGQIVAELFKPLGIHVDESNNNVYVASYALNSVQQFDKNANLIRKIGMDFLRSPYDFAFIPGSHSTNVAVVIADSENHRIIKMQMNHAYNMQLIAGVSKRAGNKQNEFNEPRRVRFDSKGNLLVLDSNNHRVQKFSIQNNTCHV